MTPDSTGPLPSSGSGPARAFGRIVYLIRNQTLFVYVFNDTAFV